MASENHPCRHRFLLEQDADIGRRNPTQAGDDALATWRHRVEIVKIGLWQRLYRRIRSDGAGFVAVATGRLRAWPFRLRRCGSSSARAAA